MKLNQLDLNLLKVFVTVYQAKSLRLAAEQLFVSTPAVSQSIKKLKQSLGEELFVLANKQFLPTPFSEQLYQRIAPLMEGINLAIEQGKQFDPSLLQESFHLEVNPHVLPWLTPELYLQLAQQSPQSTLVSQTLSQNSLQKLQQGKIDFVIQFDGDLIPADIIAVPLGSLKFVLAVRKDHPVKSAMANINQLLQYPFAHVDLAYFGQNKYSRLEEEMIRQGKPINIGLRTTSIVGLIETVKQSNIIAPCMPPVVEQHKADIRAILVEGLSGLEQVQVFAYLHKKNQYSPKFKWLLDLIETAMCQPEPT